MALIDELDKMSEEARLEAERAGCTVPQAVMPAGMGGHPGAAPAGHPGRPTGHPGHPAGAPAGGHPGHPGAITGGHHPGAAPGAAPGTKGGSSYRPGTSPQAKAYEERTGIKPPTIVAWEITRSCNLACAHCRAAAHLEPYPGELSLAECKAVIDDIASISDPILIVTGGEPLMRPDIWDIIAYAFEKGLHPVIGTNGTMIDDAMAKKIADAGVPKVSVSLDFPDAEGQDAFRGQKGAFDETVQGIKNLEKYGVHVQVNTTVTKANATKLDEIHNVSKELGATDFHPFLLVPTGRGEDLIDVELTPEEYDEVLTWAYHRQKTSCMAFKPTDAPQYFRIMRQQAASEGIRITPATHGRMAVSRGCLGGISFVFISHTGDVQPCGYFDMQLGNVKEQKFSDIWTNSPVFDDLRHYDRLKGKCGACEYKGVCGGCRARALSVYGDYLETEPYCAYVPPKYARDLVLDTIQSGFPIVADPYGALADQLGLTRDQVRSALATLYRRDMVHRVGASFDSRKLGYTSTLCAMAVPGGRAELERVAGIVGSFPQITHNYGRDNRYNLWFTLITRSPEEKERIKQQIRERSGIDEILDLPATKMYKIRVDFGRQGKKKGARVAQAPRAVAAAIAESESLKTANRPSTAKTVSAEPAAEPVPFDACDPFDVALVRWAQGDICRSPESIAAAQEATAAADAAEGETAGRFGASAVPDAEAAQERAAAALLERPFAYGAQAINAELGREDVTEEMVMERLRQMKAAKSARRVGAMVRHRKIGYAYNSMTVWDVPDDEADAAGAVFKAADFVSHAYSRPRNEHWQANLYAMCHAQSAEELAAHVRELEERLADADVTVRGHEALSTTDEFKKMSMTYFVEED